MRAKSHHCAAPPQVVSLCNTYTCQLLLAAASATRTRTFEELCHAVGGRAFMRLAQAANIVLLAGNLTGDLCLLADLGSKCLVASLGTHAPALLTLNHGRGVMLLLTAAVIVPLSLLRSMHALEHASSAGVLVLLALCAVLTADAAGSGFAGVASGEVPLWTLNWRSGHVAEAFALLGFSFYLHPLMMPMLQDMPPGARGVRIMSRAVAAVVPGAALAAICYIAAMGAAAFGARTQGDIMLNNLLHARWASLALAVAMLTYLSTCIPPLVLSLRAYLDFIVAGPRAAFSARRHAALTAAIIALPLALAWRDPSLSETAFSVTGATGVCVVCYVVPVLAHFRLLFGKPGVALQALPGDGQPTDVGGGAAEPLLPVAGGRGDMDGSPVSAIQGVVAGEQVEYTRPPKGAAGWIRDVVLPLGVLALGCSLSSIALYTALTRR